MGLLDCVASPEGRDRFNENERPYQRPTELSRSDHDISRRRSRPLFASQTSLKNIRDVDFWRQRVLQYLFSPEGKEDIRVLRIPFSQLGYNSVTDFIEEIPPELFQDYQNQPPPDEGILKEYKVFWVRDGIAEPGTFKWQGIIENENCLGLQLDRKKAVPYGLYDGKGLFYCKPGHRAIVPEYEVTPYKKFLRGFIGLPPRKDSLQEFGDSVRLSARAIQAKNSKPGDRVFLSKEKKWATVQWIGKIGNETVVDLIYERPKPTVGQAVSPDEPCISRSMSLADFIGELASEPNTPSAIQPQPENISPKSPRNYSNVPKSPQPSSISLPPKNDAAPKSPSINLPNESNRYLDDSETDSDLDSEDNSDDDSESPSDSEPEDLYADSSEDEKVGKVLPRSKEMDDVTKVSKEEIQVLSEESPPIPSPKRKGFFGFSPKNKRSKPLPSIQKDVKLKEKIKSETELQPKSPKPTRSKSPNIFARFKKNKETKREKTEDFEVTNEAKSSEQKIQPDQPKKSKGWSGLFKSKSKSSISKLEINDSVPDGETPQTPVDKMIPPDQIPTPPPDINERRIERPDYLELSKDSSSEQQNEIQPKITKPIPPGPPSQSFEEAKAQRGGVRHDLKLQSSEDEAEENASSDDDEVKMKTAVVDLHEPLVVRSNTSTDEKVEQVIESPAHENREEDFPVYLAICPPYVPPAERKGKSPSPPPVPTSPPPEIDDLEQEETPADDIQLIPPQNLLDKFKESKVRNRPSSFGSFLARIKNQKKSPGEIFRYPDGSTPPPSTEEVTEQTPETDENSKPVTVVDQNSSREDDSVTSTNKEQSNRETNKNSVPLPEEIKVEELPPSSPVNGNSTEPIPVVDNEGDQEGIMLDLLDVKETAPPTGNPPPVTPEETPKQKGRTFSFTFSRKRKSSQPQTPASPNPSEVQETQNENVENIDPSDNETKEKKSKGSSFRSSFRRTFSLTRKNKTQNQDSFDENCSVAPQSPTGNEITKPRPVTLYIDNNEVVQQKQKKNSFRNKRPASLVVDLKPWSMRHGTEGVDIYSSPSSDEATKSPPSRSPNPSLMPKVEIVDIPKHRIFTTPAFFYRNKGKKGEETNNRNSKTKYEMFSKKKDSDDAQSPTPTPTLPIRPKTPPPLPSSPPPKTVIKQRPKSTSFESSPPPESPKIKLKSALKQRKEIESIPKGLKIGDRVLWYSGEGPIPGTVQKMFKDGTDKYTAMVKFDRDVKDAPLRLVREGDAYIVTVEELITPDMFEPRPVYANQEQIGLSPTQTIPSVRFDDKDEPSDGESEKDDEELDLPPPFQEEEVQMACGYRRGIQSRDKSCCLESILFSLFYTSNAFDIALLYGNSTGEDKLTRNVRKILRKEIVDPLRREGFASCNAVKRLREAVKPLSEEWQTMSTDAEVMMFILFDRVLKLGKFLTYSNEMSDFLHQLVVDTKDLSKSTTVQHLFEASLHLMDNIKLKTVPTPALILEMPRSNDKLMQYKAVIPNLSLHVSHLLQDGTRLCICGMVAQYECSHCTKNVGRMSIVYCENCKGTADIIHFQLPHEAELSHLNQPVVILDLAAIICVKQGHYISFVKCGKENHSPWVYYDGAETEEPKVCIEQNLGMWLDRLEKYPGKYQDALQYPLLTQILQDSHICIYQSREKSSSV